MAAISSKPLVTRILNKTLEEALGRLEKMSALAATALSCSKEVGDNAVVIHPECSTIFIRHVNLSLPPGLKEPGIAIKNRFAEAK